MAKYSFFAGSTCVVAGLLFSVNVLAAESTHTDYAWVAIQGADSVREFPHTPVSADSSTLETVGDDDEDC